MNSGHKLILLLLILSGSTIISASAQVAGKKTEKEMSSKEDEFSPVPKHIFIVEIDPLPYLWGGAGGHFGWTPKGNKHFAYGAGIIAGPELPDAVHNMSSKNKNQGWHLKVNQGASLWTHYYYRQPNKGWYSGLQLITQEMKLTNDHFPGEADRTNTLIVALSTGYVWYPSKKVNLYLRPWAGLAYQKTIKSTFEPGEVTPEMVVGDREYHLSSLLPFATFHIGYKF